MDTYAHIVGLKERKTSKILYWNAISKYTGKLLDSNTNIAILKSRFGDSCDYKPVR